MPVREVIDSVLGVTTQEVNNNSDDSKCWGIILYLNTKGNCLGFRDRDSILHFSKALVDNTHIKAIHKQSKPMYRPDVQRKYNAAYIFLNCEEDTMFGVDTRVVISANEEMGIVNWIKDNVPMVNDSSPIFVWYRGRNFERSNCKISVRGYLLAEEINRLIDQCVEDNCGKTDEVSIHQVL